MEPLALGPDWRDPLPLISLDEALERTLLDSGLTRESLLQRLIDDVGRPWLHPLLWVLPRRWRLSPASLPPRLQGLSALVQQGLMTPMFLAALVDDLAHLWPPSADTSANALELWRSECVTWQGTPLGLPSTIAALLSPELCPSDVLSDASQAVPAFGQRFQNLAAGLCWHNVGLDFSQSVEQRCRNAVMAQLLNRLAANAITAQPFLVEGCKTGGALLALLQRTGWQVQARLRSSVASFGFGAALVQGGQRVRQIPLALPMRTGLLDASGEEATTLLPHTALELEISNGQATFRLQWFQGTNGLCGWDALNDLHRPWQNDRHNGTVRYLGEPFTPAVLQRLFPATELISLIHNQEACARHLRVGGYGTLGFCIDSIALLQLMLQGRCDLFPLVLTGLWRERLEQRASKLSAGVDAQALADYRQALRDCPLDLSHHGASTSDAWRRLRASLPLVSPFALIQQLQASAAL